MRRRHARILTLVLIAGLAVLWCACGHIATHRCDHGPRCPICECVRLGLRGPALPLLALMVFGGALLVPMCRIEHRAARLPSPYDKRVRLND